MVGSPNYNKERTTRYKYMGSKNIVEEVGLKRLGNIMRF